MPQPDLQHKQPPVQQLIPHELPVSSFPQPAVYTYQATQPLLVPTPTVYNYVNPLTNERIVSLLPPNHPEMICLQAGEHVTETSYGLLGMALFYSIPYWLTVS